MSATVQRSQRPLPKDDPALLRDYAELVARFPDADYVVDQDGVYRFRRHEVARWLCDQINLNVMWAAYGMGKFSQDEFVKFYMDIGYSLDGFYEVWGDELGLYSAPDPDPSGAEGPTPGLRHRGSA